MSLVFYDTYKRKKVPFEPLQENTVRIYNCGPTVYGIAHIGNFRANVFSDILRRWLEVKGFKVHQVMNLTDVDDKTIRDSRKAAKSIYDYTEPFIVAFFEDIDRMNIQRAELYPKATDHIDEMVDLIQRLTEKGHAYETDDGSIYFSVMSFPEYGNLSGKRLEDLQIGQRVSSDEYESKDDVRDFALWKAWTEEDGDVFWETPIGKGRPGWHIECSAMSMKYHGETFDIHTGGVDNIFPHHENEIAQSRCAVDGEFSRYWMHCEYLVVDGKKMSKSLGNYYTIPDLLEQGYKPREIRYVLAGTQYRSQLNFTIDGLNAARQSLARLDEFYENLEGYSSPDDLPADDSVTKIIMSAEKSFEEAMDDDLNVSRAMAAVFNLIRQVNSLISQNNLSSSDVEQIKSLWKRWDHALGYLFPFETESASSEIDPEWVEERISARRSARDAKDWAAADQIRDELDSAGIILKDTAEGTSWKLK